ncbi:hypothetical protein L226DRAFT_118430 [Lentinus tigrinus ALCF2SS1-7]|uniref:Uncharacterized protein n=1 Tax=Lentinus tigrinus ALCF2SS1-6 TaxID=1328759 RepID=A0A5C2SSZ9_9APHY|nr:hypothetical protein L227DRAFT_3866 [Lentinus tigrinus ALCF2SS1-6]RPD80723.1 hypothetical protein L226DRAFT_118430 [Lentinus tigrinus ALCF2SS1-7]
MSFGSHVVRDGLEARQLLGLPAISLPGLGDLTSVLGLPGGGSTTSTIASTASTTSVRQPTTTTGFSLTLLSSTPATTLSTSSSSAPSTSASAASTADSVTTSSTSASTATTSSSSTDSTSASVTLPPGTSNSVTNTATVTVPASGSTSSSSASSSASAAAADAPKSFLQNKPLSVGVITAASLVGLVIIIAIATWAIRKRRNDRLHEDILDFSNANLVNESHDVEKGDGVGSSLGHGSSSSTGHGTIPPAVQPRHMYQDSYAASTPTFAPPPAPSRYANAYGAQPQYASNAYGGYVQNSNNWGYGYGNATQTGYDQAYAGTEDAYGGIAEYSAMAGVGAGAQTQAQPPANPPQRRPSAQRKPPPALDIPPTNPIAQPTNAPSPISSQSINNPPLQPAAAPPALPDEFGASAVPAASPQDPTPVRRLVVRNE